MFGTQTLLLKMQTEKMVLKYKLKVDCKFLWHTVKCKIHY